MEDIISKSLKQAQDVLQAFVSNPDRGDGADDRMKTAGDDSCGFVGFPQFPFAVLKFNQ